MNVPADIRVAILAAGEIILGRMLTQDEQNRVLEQFAASCPKFGEKRDRHRMTPEDAALVALGSLLPVGMHELCTRWQESEEGRQSSEVLSTILRKYDRGEYGPSDMPPAE